MYRSHRAFVARVHRLQHIDDFITANLTDHDPIRAHAQRISNQFASGDIAFALDVGRPRFQTHHVRLLQA